MREQIYLKDKKLKKSKVYETQLALDPPIIRFWETDEMM